MQNTIDGQKAEIADQAAQLADKDSQIAALKAQLAAQQKGRRINAVTSYIPS